MFKIITPSINSEELRNFCLYPFSEKKQTYVSYFEMEKKLLNKNSENIFFGVFEKGFLLDLDTVEHNNKKKSEAKVKEKYSSYNYPYLSAGLLTHLGFVKDRKLLSMDVCKSYDLGASVQDWYSRNPRYSKPLLEKFKKSIIELDPKLKKQVDKVFQEKKLISYCYIFKNNIFEQYIALKEQVFGELLAEESAEQLCINLVDSFKVLETIFLLAFVVHKGYDIDAGLQPIHIENFKFFSPFSPKFEVNNVPILLSSSNYYVPYCDVVIKSIVGKCNANSNYDIIILEQDITENNKKILKQNEKSNISIRFLDPRAFYFDTPEFYKAVEEFGVTRFAPILSYRAFCPYFLEHYDKVIWLDCDLIVRKDLNELYSIDLENNYAGMVRDLAIMGFLNGAHKELGEYYFKSCSMINPYMYSNAGVVLLNLDLIRKEIPFETFTKACLERKHAIPEQDTINALWEGRVKHIDMRWNVFTFGNDPSWGLGFVPVSFLQVYKDALKDPWIIHYVGPSKPWDDLTVRMSNVFWEEARQSPFYEEMLNRKMSVTSETSTSVVSKLEKAVLKLLPIHSRRRLFVKKIYRFLVR